MWSEVVHSAVRNCSCKRLVWQGRGTNDCNTCTCTDGALGCTKIGCDSAPCGQKSCTLQCGTVVASGWSGKDEGTNDCNTCHCTDGALGCTKIGCDSAPCGQKSCTLQCGTVVASGWSGKDEGTNDCNTCTCTDGALGCTKESHPILVHPRAPSVQVQVLQSLVPSSLPDQPLATTVPH